MKNLLKLLGLGILSIVGICANVTKTSSKPILDPQNAIVLAADPEEETFECSVTIAETKHGTISVDKTAGHIGDIVTITAKHDLFYLVSYVKVNGTDLIEDEEISGKYTFALVEGVNAIEGKFIIDEELLGEMSVIIEQINNKDWTNLFSIDNVIRIVTFLLNGGILIAMIRYVIKDKKLAAIVEKNVSSTVKEIVPNTTKEIVIKTISDVLEPIFAQMHAENSDMMNAMTVFAKCMALSQENTPEARRAILDELSSLKIGDAVTIKQVQEYLEKFISEKINSFNSLMNKLDSVAETNQKIVEENSQLEHDAEKDNGHVDDGVQYE